MAILTNPAIVETWELHNTNPPHNKQYTVGIELHGSGWNIHTEWGKIGGHFSPGCPYINVSTLEAARINAEGIVNAKMKSGYHVIKHYSKGGIEEMTKAKPEEVKTEETKPEEKKFDYTEKTIELDMRDVNSFKEEDKLHIPSKEYYSDTGYLKPIVYGIKFNKPVLLVGDTGCGKTASVRFLAGITNNPLRRVNLNGSTTVDEFVGKWRIDKGSMIWVDGVLVECMRQGYWLLCDEINAVLPEIAFVLHSVLDDDQMVVLTQKDGETLKAHPNFRFFGTMNPDYSGTHRLNAAFQDRFIVVEMDYPQSKEEVEILKTRTGIEDVDLLKKMVEIAKKARSEFRNEKITSTFSTRKLIFWAEMCKVFPPAKAFKYAVLNKLPKDDVKPVMDIASIVFPDDDFRNILELK